MLDIILVVWAWRRGWKGWALLPPAITFFLAIIIGINSGGDFGVGLVILMVAYLGTMIFMIARPRKKERPDVVESVVPPVVTPEVRKPVTGPLEPELVKVIEPKTVIEPAYRASLVFPNKGEISLVEDVTPVGRKDFDRTVSPEDLQYISRQHLMVKSDSGKYFVEDHASANGTSLNGIDIKGKGNQELRDGDRINVADKVSLTFKA